MNPKNIKDRIFNKKKQGRDYVPEKDFGIAHHMLMKWYGWIPIKELKEIPDPMFFELLKHCQDEETNEYNKFRNIIKAITGKDIGER